MGGREVGGLATMLAAHMNFEPDDLQRLARFWGTERLAQTPGLMAVELFAAIGRGEVKAVWIMGTNPAVSLPDSHAVSQALAGCPLVIVSEVMLRPIPAVSPISVFRRWPGERKMARSPTRSGASPASAAFCRRRERQSGLVDHRPVAQALGYARRLPGSIRMSFLRACGAVRFENDGQRAFDIGALADLSREAWDAWRRFAGRSAAAAGDFTRGWHRDGRCAWCR
jgi:assimilatory nitrate reductase catalytic subunit